MLACDGCQAPAVFTRRQRSLLYTSWTQTRFCGGCFTAWLESRVFDNIDSFGLIEPGDRVLLCVSGEKDSTVMLHLVARYARAREVDAELIVLTVDEGISDYRARCAELVRGYAAGFGLRFEVRAYARDYGMGLDQIHAERPEGGYRMCMYCCSLRGKTVKSVADEFQVNKVATGMNLNDCVEHAMMCLMKGSIDQQGLPRYSPPGSSVEFVAPIYNVTGLECGLFAHLNQVRLMNEDCLYCAEHLRDDVSHSLNLLEDRNPGILESFYRGYCLMATGSESPPRPARPAPGSAVADAGQPR